ncbi:MAG: hypothetical protein WBK76_02870 [Candidatus Saccharimonadales bacterium]|jgi:hypothetical protein|nr:hypothetical protein [Patescibacteria group bacterium]
MKQLALLGAILFGAIGSYVPALFGDTNLLSGWSILGGMVGGLFGIWVGVKLYRMMN